MPRKTTTQTPVDVAAVRDKLRRCVTELQAQLVERDDPIMCGVLALLSGKHLVLVGPPGEAKSQVARALAAIVTDATYWEWQFANDTTTDQTIAHLDAKAFIADGVQRYVFDGHAPSAHVQLWDEVYKMPTGTRNAHLGLMQERKVWGFKSPLISIVAASNEWPEEKNGPFADRLPFKFEVGPIASDDAYLRAARGYCSARAGGGTGNDVTLSSGVTLAELGAAQAAVQALIGTIPDEVLVGLRTVMRQCRGASVQVTTRLSFWACDILAAYAWYQGDAQVELDHLDILRHVLWQMPDEREAVGLAIANAMQGVVAEVRRLASEPLRLYGAVKDDRPRLVGRGPSLMGALETAGNQIRTLFDAKGVAREKGRVQAVLDELAEAYSACSEASSDPRDVGAA